MINISFTLDIEDHRASSSSNDSTKSKSRKYRSEHCSCDSKHGKIKSDSTSTTSDLHTYKSQRGRKKSLNKRNLRLKLCNINAFDKSTQTIFDSRKSPERSSPRTPTLSSQTLTPKDPLNVPNIHSFLPIDRSTQCMVELGINESSFHELDGYSSVAASGRCLPMSESNQTCVEKKFYDKLRDLADQMCREFGSRERLIGGDGEEEEEMEPKQAQNPIIFTKTPINRTTRTQANSNNRGEGDGIRDKPSKNKIRSNSLPPSHKFDKCVFTIKNTVERKISQISQLKFIKYKSSFKHNQPETTVVCQNESEKLIDEAGDITLDGLDLEEFDVDEYLSVLEAEEKAVSSEAQKLHRQQNFDMLELPVVKTNMDTLSLLTCSTAADEESFIEDQVADSKIDLPDPIYSPVDLQGNSFWEPEASDTRRISRSLGIEQTAEKTVVQKFVKHHSSNLSSLRTNNRGNRRITKVHNHLKDRRDTMASITFRSMNSFESQEDEGLNYSMNPLFFEKNFKQIRIDPSGNDWTIQSVDQEIDQLNQFKSLNESLEASLDEKLTFNPMGPRLTEKSPPIINQLHQNDLFHSDYGTLSSRTEVIGPSEENLPKTAALVQDSTLKEVESAATISEYKSTVCTTNVPNSDENLHKNINNKVTAKIPQIILGTSATGSIEVTNSVKPQVGVPQVTPETPPSNYSTLDANTNLTFQKRHSFSDMSFIKIKEFKEFYEFIGLENLKKYNFFEHNETETGSDSYSSRSRLNQTSGPGGLLSMNMKKKSSTINTLSHLTLRNSRRSSIATIFTRQNSSMTRSYDRTLDRYGSGASGAGHHGHGANAGNNPDITDLTDAKCNLNLSWLQKTKRKIFKGDVSDFIQANGFISPLRYCSCDPEKYENLSESNKISRKKYLSEMNRAEDKKYGSNSNLKMNLQNRNILDKTHLQDREKIMKRHLRSVKAKEKFNGGQNADIKCQVLEDHPHSAINPIIIGQLNRRITDKKTRLQSNVSRGPRRKDSFVKALSQGQNDDLRKVHVHSKGRTATTGHKKTKTDRERRERKTSTSGTGRDGKKRRKSNHSPSRQRRKISSHQQTALRSNALSVESNDTPSKTRVTVRDNPNILVHLEPDLLTNRLRVDPPLSKSKGFGRLQKDFERLWFHIKASFCY